MKAIYQFIKQIDGNTLVNLGFCVRTSFNYRSPDFGGIINCISFSEGCCGKKAIEAPCHTFLRVAIGCLYDYFICSCCNTFALNRRRNLFSFVILSLSAIISCCDVSAATASTSYSYDSLNRLTNAVYSDGSGESYSYDPAGNKVSRITLAATNLLDTTPPTVPANLATNDFTPGQILLSWSRSYDTGGSGLSGYRVYVNGSLAADTTATSFLLTGLLFDTEYCLTVAAYDHYTNISAASQPFCVYIPSGAGSATVKITPVLFAAQPSSSWTEGADKLRMHWQMQSIPILWSPSLVIMQCAISGSIGITLRIRKTPRCGTAS